MPNKKQIPRVGTKLPQKPMPKEDKGGGIIPTAEGARVVLANSAAGRQFAAPLRCFSVLYSLSTSGKPALGNRNPKRDMDRNLARPIAITL